MLLNKPRGASAAEVDPWSPVPDIEWYENTLRAYNHLLHRVWIDKPSYVEDCLTETNEWYVLDSLMNSHWEDTFEFYNEEDSLSYHLNLDDIINPGCYRVVKHIVIPEKTQQKLDEVFGNGD